jgi:electron transfer flavoprotein beta subunit
MKVLVCISKTPDTTTKIVFNADNTALNEAGVQFIMNPYDEWYALVRGIDLAKQLNGTCTVISVGATDCETILRKALAIGADDAVRIDIIPDSAQQVAFQIANYAQSNEFGVVFTGKETIDYNGSEVGAMIAEYLTLPFISYASQLEVAGSTATISRDIEGGTEILEVDIPFVVSAAKGLAEQRIPNMMGIMKAKSKPLQVVPPVAFEQQVKLVSFEAPKPKSAVKMIDPDQMDELVRLLHEEAKVI